MANISSLNFLETTAKIKYSLLLLSILVLLCLLNNTLTTVGSELVS